MSSLQRLDTNISRDGRGETASFLSPVAYDDDAASLHSRSEQDTDSDDDELQSRARNSRELLAADRIVLMEEDELDRLVTDTRKKQERERRGSGLNPLQIFGRRGSFTQMSSANSSRENLAAPSSSTEKRQQRRTRRQKKKQKLKEDAQHGEDGELMYEMEEGGMKEGSSTGDSSERDDSEEVDRRHLNLIANAKAQRGRSWRRWLFIHAIIAVGFAILVLAAWKLSKNRKGRGFVQEFRSNGTALFAPTTILISLDGFRADFLQRGLTPRLNAFIKEGVSPKYMLPSFPSVTFPNHYTLATGLYPESHGVVGNTFWAPEFEAEFYYTDPDRSMQPKWWGGEPFWVTAERQGIRSAVHMWPGSEAHVMDVEPSFTDKFNGDEALPNKVARILEFLDKPGKEDQSINVEHMRPQMIAAYVPNVDADGHKYGPNSTEIRSTIKAVDDMMDQIFTGLSERNLTDIVNVVVVSDHGMATTDVSRLIQLEDLIDLDKIDHMDGWPLYGLRLKNPDDLQVVYNDLADKTYSNPNIDVYLRDQNMPERYHFSNNERIAPLWLVPKTGWAIVTKEEFDIAEAKEKGLVYHPRGLHGYDHEHPLMRAIFIARGPAFPHPANSEMEVFQNIEVYNIICDSVGIHAQPNNGTLRLPLKPIGEHKDEDTPATPEDPVPTNAVPTDDDEPIKSNKPPMPSPDTSDDGSGAKQGDDNKDGKDKGKGKSFWQWITDKVDKMWSKITGSGSD